MLPVERLRTLLKILTALGIVVGFPVACTWVGQSMVELRVTRVCRELDGTSLPDEAISAHAKAAGLFFRRVDDDRTRIVGRFVGFRAGCNLVRGRDGRVWAWLRSYTL